jgi:hypothetical protein
MRAAGRIKAKFPTPSKKSIKRGKQAMENGRPASRSLKDSRANLIKALFSIQHFCCVFGQ